MTEPAGRRGPGIGLGVIAALVGISALNDWAQVLATVTTGSGEPPLLLALHVVSGALGVAAAVATWRRSPRAPMLVLLWGAATVVLLLCVPIAVGLEGAAAMGVRYSAAVVAVFVLAFAWATRRLLARATPGRTPGRTD